MADIPSDADVGVGFSDKTLLIASITGFCLVVGTLIFLRSRTTDEAAEDDDEDGTYEKRLAQADVSTLTRSQRRARAHIIMKEKRKVDKESDDGPQLSRKDRQRAAKAAELAERKFNEAERKRREAISKEEAMREREKRNSEREAREELAREEELALQKQQQMAYDTFLSSNAGKVLLVNDWISSMKRQSTPVDMSLLASEYDKTENDVIVRIETLQTEGRIVGLFDKNNKFLYLPDEQVDAVIGKMKEAGTVSLLDLGQLCAETLLVSSQCSAA